MLPNKDNANLGVVMAKKTQIKKIDFRFVVIELLFSVSDVARFIGLWYCNKGLLLFYCRASDTNSLSLVHS